MIIQESVQKLTNHLIKNDGVTGFSYSTLGFVTGAAPTVLGIPVVDIFQILAFGGTFIVAMLTSYGMIKKYIKEYKQEKTKLKNE